MARDPNITATERVLVAARRWAACSDDAVDILRKDHEQELFARSNDLARAVFAYEKHHGMRMLKFTVRPILRGTRRARKSAEKRSKDQ